MIPDKIEEEETQIAKKFGVFGATLITFFFAEMGDKTQIAPLRWPRIMQPHCSL